MGVRRAWLVVAVLLVPGRARSDEHWGELCAGVEHGRASVLWGGRASFAWNTPKEQPALKNLALVLDYSRLTGEHETTQVRHETLLGGVRRVFALRPDRTHRQKKVQLFLQGLTGLLWSTATDRTPRKHEPAWALAVGGGVDLLVLGTPEFALRFQGDFVIPASDVNPIPRGSANLVWRLGEGRH
jgi:hypothetical protein